MFKRSQSFDVAIVGGGPAGATCALMLARKGVRVILVHRAAHQLNRVELVSGRARRLIEQHFSESSVSGVEIHETISLWGTPEPVTWNAMSNPWGSGVAVERAAFDEALLAEAKRAGATIVCDELKSAVRSAGQWQLSLHERGSDQFLNANFLIVATGIKGRQLICRKGIGKPSQFALMAQVKTEVRQQRNALFLELARNGWWYMLPNPTGGYFAGFCTDHTIAGIKPLLDTFANRLNGSRLLADFLPDVLTNVVVTGCPAGPRIYEQVTGDGWICVGDAAFAVDPLSGEGIEFAVESSLLAVQVLMESMAPQSLRNYEETVRNYADNHKQIREMYLTGTG